MAVAQLLLSMEPKYICHNQCTMDTSSPIVPKLSTEILLIPAILELYHKPPLKEIEFLAFSLVSPNFELFSFPASHVSQFHPFFAIIFQLSCEFLKLNFWTKILSHFLDFTWNFVVKVLNNFGTLC